MSLFGVRFPLKFSFCYSILYDGMKGRLRLGVFASNAIKKIEITKSMTNIHKRLIEKDLLLFTCRFLKANYYPLI